MQDANHTIQAVQREIRKTRLSGSATFFFSFLLFTEIYAATKRTHTDIHNNLKLQSSSFAGVQLNEPSFQAMNHEKGNSFSLR